MSRGRGTAGVSVGWRGGGEGVLGLVTDARPGGGHGGRSRGQAGGGGKVQNKIWGLFLTDSLLPKLAVAAEGYWCLLLQKKKINLQEKQTKGIKGGSKEPTTGKRRAKGKNADQMGPKILKAGQRGKMQNKRTIGGPKEQRRAMHAKGTKV